MRNFMTILFLIGLCLPFAAAGAADTETDAQPITIETLAAPY